MASTAALDKRLTELEVLMREVIRASETATRAYAENQEPFERAVRTIREEIKARFNGLDQRIMKLEGRS